MKILRILFCVFLVTVVCSHCAVAAKVSIQVVDEEGHPIVGAKVGVGFNYNTGWGTNNESNHGFSDTEGNFTATGGGNGHVSYGAKKEGYYNSHYSYDFIKTGILRWEPHNPELQVMLRKIENPVPMYARDIRTSPIEIPAVDKDVGFDLIEFDWVSPYGRGVHSDFIFHLDKGIIDRKNFDEKLTIFFLNSNDGIQPYYEEMQYGSDFKLPRAAPMGGYQTKLELHAWRAPDDNSVQRNFDFVKNDLNYFFRIRSQDKDGEVSQAMYGKILEPIRFSALRSPTAKIAFKYYLNPDGSKNLEYDPKRNLFEGLPPREWVGIK